MSINYIIVIILGLWLFAGRRARARGLLKHVRAFPYESFCANGVLWLALTNSQCSFFFSFNSHTINSTSYFQAYSPLMTKRTRAKLHLTLSPNHRIVFLAHEYKKHRNNRKSCRFLNIRTCLLVKNTMKIYHRNTITNLTIELYHSLHVYHASNLSDNVFLFG